MLASFALRASPVRYGLRNSSGNFATFAAMRLGSSLLSNLAAERQPGSHSKAVGNTRRGQPAICA